MHVIGFENIRIPPSTRYRIRCEFIFFRCGVRIQKYPDSLPNSPDACGRKPYPERKICGFKNIRIRVDGAGVVIQPCVCCNVRTFFKGFCVSNMFNNSCFKSLCLREWGRLGNEGRSILLKIGTHTYREDSCNILKLQLHLPYLG